MMDVNKVFCQFFDKTVLTGFKESSDIWRIHEESSSAFVKDLEVKKSGAIFKGFDQLLTKSMDSLTTKRSSTFKDKECDGVAFVKISAEERLLFVELKSKYDTSRISCALEQMCCSFLKMHSMLSLCKGYSLYSLPIDFCAVTLCCRDDDEHAKVNMFISQALMSDEQKDIGSFFDNLFSKGYVNITFNRLFKILNIDLPLHDDIMNKDIKVYLTTTPSCTENKAVFSY